MKFDWSEYFKLAEELAGVSGDSAASQEAKLRSAISRAYYSVFCNARNYLRDVEKDPELSQEKKTSNAHWDVINKFIEHPSKSRKMKDIGRDLARLRRARNKADYDDIIFGLKGESRNAFNLAQGLMRALTNIS